jgi:hypothetical protein
MQEMEKDEWARGDPRELAAREKEELDKPFEQERAEMARTKEEQEKKPQEAPGKATLEAGREEESIAIPQAKQKLNFKDMMYDLRSTMAGKENFVKMRFQGILWTEFHRTTLENAAQIGTGTMPACQFRWMLFHAMADRLSKYPPFSSYRPYY